MAIFLGLFVALPGTLIVLILFVMIRYFVRTGEWTRFSLRSLFVVMTGFAVIAAIASWVPIRVLWKGTLGIAYAEQVVIEVVDKATQSPISNADVVLISNTVVLHKRHDSRKTTNQQSKTNVDGVVEFQSECTSANRKAILRTWKTYRTDGWSLEAMAPGYQPATKILKRVIDSSPGRSPLKFRIELVPNPPVKANGNQDLTP